MCGKQKLCFSVYNNNVNVNGYWQMWMDAMNTATTENILQLRSHMFFRRLYEMAMWAPHNSTATCRTEKNM